MCKLVGAVEEWEEDLRWVAAPKQPIEEMLKELLHVCFTGAERVDSVAVPEDEASKDTGRVCRVGGDE